MKVDVLRKVNSTQIIRKNGAVLTHMPEGSVVMWSGWRTELPDGWKFCTGIDTTNSTSKCNFVDYFVVGKKPVDTINNKITGAEHQYSIATGSEYKHTHSSDHSHSSFSSTSHNHSAFNVNNNNSNSGTWGDNAGGSTGRVGTAAWYKWERYGWECCWKGKWRKKWFDYDLANSKNNNNNGHHSHSVLMNHGHSASVDRPSHNHALGNKNHEHDNVVHDHDVENQPEYYTLAFIYLVGEVQ